AGASAAYLPGIAGGVRPRLKSLRAWSRDVGISYATPRRALRDPVDALPAKKLFSRWRVDQDEADGWLERRSRRAEVDVSSVVDEVIYELRGTDGLKMTFPPKGG